MAKIPEMNYVTLDQLLERTTNRNVVSLCLGADIALGGGIPFGCSAVFAGKPKTGKTTTALQIAANAQKQYPEAELEYYNKEARLTKKVLGQIQGLDKKRTKIIEPPEIKNKSGEVIGREAWSSEVWLHHLGESIANSKRKIMIFDSISSLASEKQLSEEVGYQDRGASKKIESSFYTKYGDLVVPNEHILIFIAQGYANTSGMGKWWVVKIGSSLMYQADLITLISKIEPFPTASKEERSLGHTAVFEIQESPLGFPDETMRIPIRYGHGIDREKDAVELGVEWGVLEKKGGGNYVLPFNEKIKEAKKDDNVKIRGEVKLRNYLLTEPKALEYIEEKIKGMVWPDGQ